MIGLKTTLDEVKNYIPPKEDQDEDDYQDELWENDNVLYYDGDYLLGEILVDSDKELADGELSIEQIAEITTKLSEKYPISKDKFKLIYGQRPC